MKKVVGIVLAVALVLSVGGAWAAEVEGKIQKLDPSERTLVLEDGTKIWVAEGVAIDSLKEGSEVKASYEERDGKNVATSVQVKD